MPLTSYCKKCGCDVPVGPFCPDCGAKLPANTVRLAWCVDHTPVRDWMCWNAVMRVTLPVMGMTFLLTLLLEAIMGGMQGVENVLGGALAVSLVGLLGFLLACLLLVLMLQGDDLLDCVIDAKGLHVQTYLPSPTPLKLLLRLKSPHLMDTLEDDGLLLISQKEILWKDIQRVQLWPEKNIILLYAPRWWMRLALPCSPFTWEDALAFIRDKIGKKRSIVLPLECVQTAPPKAKAAPRRTRQLSIEDIPPQPIPPEETPDWTADAPEQPGDFTPLADVLQEIRQNEQA